MMFISNHFCLQGNIQVKFFQKDAEKQEEEVFQGGVEEGLSPAEVDDEHAVQQVLTWSGLNISPVRKEEEEVKFLQKYAQEKGDEDFKGGVEGSLRPAEVDDENSVQQVLTRPGQNISLVRKEEEKVSSADRRHFSKSSGTCRVE
ncbi:hypothetical protein AOLI_G00257340 [Acnodon oligacanthus]